MTGISQTNLTLTTEKTKERWGVGWNYECRIKNDELRNIMKWSMQKERFEHQEIHNSSFLIQPPSLSITPFGSPGVVKHFTEGALIDAD